MNPIIERIAQNARLLFENQNIERITKTNPYLYAVSHLCITNRELMGQIPAEDAGYVGFAYMNILDLTEDSSVFQIYSTISFYFTEKAIRYGLSSYEDEMKVQILNDALIIMNLGAQTICRTFAQAQGMTPRDYVNFNDLNRLPNYVREVLLVEYSYFIEFEKALRTIGMRVSDDMGLNRRYDILKHFVQTGFFDGICSRNELYEKGLEIRKTVYEYADRKLQKGDIAFV